MEEWIGQWWHRAITRLSEAPASEETVTLEEMQRSIALLYRAGGGDASMRITSASSTRHGGPRNWLQKVAGSGLRSAMPELDAHTLALPSSISVFPAAPLNRDLYLWLAAIAAVFEPTGDWIADNRAATARALQRFAGLRARHQRLLTAHLQQRPALHSLRPADALAEAAVQAALRGEDHACTQVTHRNVAPVWLWLNFCDTPGGTTGPREPGTKHASDMPQQPARSEGTRRRTRSGQPQSSRNTLLLSAKTDSLRSWSELVKLDRGTDEEPDADAAAAANDMDVLSLVRGEQTSAARVKFDLDLPSACADDLPLGPGTCTPEWDWRQRRLLPDHCAVQCVVSRPGAPFAPAAALQATARKVRRRLEILRAAPRWQRAQTVGDQMDLDAWVRFQSEVDVSLTHSDSPPVYMQRQRSERSLATLVLADLSLSTDAHANSSARVIDVIRDSLYVFGSALSGTGDAFEILGFSSVRRHNVRIQHIKGFDEAWSSTVQTRIGALKPGFYTRMGAAIRNATERLSVRPERQRLLLVLTDGKPNDLDVYEGRYGLEDTRHAIQEARYAGISPFCVTIDREAHQYLPMLFGTQGYALVRRPQDLVRQLTQAWASLAR